MTSLSYLNWPTRGQHQTDDGIWHTSLAVSICCSVSSAVSSCSLISCDVVLDVCSVMSRCSSSSSEPSVSFNSLNTHISTTVLQPSCRSPSAFGLERRRWSSPQHCYLHCLHTTHRKIKLQTHTHTQSHTCVFSWPIPPVFSLSPAGVRTIVISMYECWPVCLHMFWVSPNFRAC